MLTDWIAVFKTGTHTDGAGQTAAWTSADLDKIVAQYNPAEHEAPVVIGHPTIDGPAYGWVAALKREGELLLAQFRDLVPEFVELVQQGRFKKRSIALYPDLTLRHVGFLGATPPAVKGLPDVAFAAGAFSEVSLDHVQPEEGVMDERMKAFFQQFREMLFGAGTGPIVIQQPAGGDKPADKTAEFAEREKALAARESKLKEQEAEAAKKTALTARQLLTAEIHAFCEGLKQEGKLLPAWQELGLERFLVELPAEGTHTFADGQAAQTSLSWMKAFLRSLPKMVEFGEKAKGGSKDAKTGEAVDKKQWASKEYARNQEIYRQLNVSQEMLETVAPAN